MTATTPSHAPAWILEPRPAFRVEPQIRTDHGIERRVYVILAANGETIAETYHADAAQIAADAFNVAALARPKGRNRAN